MGEVERAEASFLLLALASFVSDDVLSRNSAGFIKVLMLRGDARLQFVTRRFMEERITRSDFLTQLLELVEREQADDAGSRVVLHSAKLASREEREALPQELDDGHFFDVRRDRLPELQHHITALHVDEGQGLL